MPALRPNQVPVTMSDATPSAMADTRVRPAHRRSDDTAVKSVSRASRPRAARAASRTTSRSNPGRRTRRASTETPPSSIPRTRGYRHGRHDRSRPSRQGPSRSAMPWPKAEADEVKAAANAPAGSRCEEGSGRPSDAEKADAPKPDPVIAAASPRATARFRCSSAARTPSSMCGRISRRCSMFP
jgi:hypothetical protein